MIRTDHTLVTVAAGAELVNTVLTGAEGITRRAIRLMIAPLANCAVVSYVDTDRYVLADSAILPALDPWVEIDRVLKPGEAWLVGIRDLAAAGHVNIRVIYQWEE